MQSLGFFERVHTVGGRQDVESRPLKERDQAVDDGRVIIRKKELGAVIHIEIIARKIEAAARCHEMVTCQFARSQSAQGMSVSLLPDFHVYTRQVLKLLLGA